jgi:hypothetical protein
MLLQLYCCCNSRLLELEAQEAQHDNQQELFMKLQKNHHDNNMKG